MASAPAPGEADAEALRAVARFAREVRLASLPAAVVRQLKTLLREGISWMALGSRRPEAQRLLAAGHPSASAAADGRRCTVVGAAGSFVFLDAVLINTALAQVHDCNDGRRLARRDGGANHPGRSVIPVALSLAEHHALSGAALLELLAVGYEVISRVNAPLPGIDAGWAAAAMAARAMGLPAEATVRALALAEFATPAQAGWSDDTDYDFDHLKYGLVARAGVESAGYADALRRLPLERCRARLAAPLPDVRSADPAAYALMHVFLKPYPCCRSLHGAIDLALGLRADPAFDVAGIASVEVRTGNRKEGLFQPVGPGTHYKRCQFSIPYATACAFLDGAVTEESFADERIAAPDVQALQAKIGCAFDPRLEFNPSGGPISQARPSTLTVTLVDGTVLRRSTIAPRGSPLNRLSEAELVAKFRAWCAPTLPVGRQDQLIALIGELDRLPDASELAALLRG